MAHAHRNTLPPAARIHEYEVVRVLGQGGFGITYLGFDLQLNGPVAIKEYFPVGCARRLPNGSVASISPEDRAMFDWGIKSFLDEARAIHEFRHPNVVQAHRYFEDRGTAYIVMEYVEGDSLSTILRRRDRLASAEWRPLFEGLLGGLEHIHQHDYLHRDIKPGNVVIRDSNGAAVLVDFGSARAATGEIRHTRVFTPAYAPLEQHGRGRQTPAADLYGLAAVSYRVLVGQLPPPAPDRILNDTIKRLEETVNGDPAWLAGLDACLAVQPGRRPQSVAELRQAISDRARARASTDAAEGRQPQSAADKKPRERTDRRVPDRGARSWGNGQNATSRIRAIRRTLARFLDADREVTKADVGCLGAFVIWPVLVVVVMRAC